MILFVRKMDMLNADLQLSHDFISKMKDKRTNAREDDSTGSFHFVAFVPIEGHLWKLDGLDRQPQKLGLIKEGEDWIYQAKPQIEARMAEYEDGQIEFSILSLVKAPLSGLVSALAENVKSLCALSAHVEAMESSWQETAASSRNEFATGLGSLVSRPDPIYELTQDIIDQADTLPSVQDVIQKNIERGVLQLWNDLIVAQAGLRTSIREEQLSNRSDQERAASRRFDYGPSVHNVVQLLAQRHFFTTKTLNV
jgi:ubiquitin carboxyl-terminal hydrolase L5